MKLRKASRIEFYKALCDWFFDQRDDLRFRVITIESQKLNLPQFHEGTAELGFYKFYYQLLTHWISPNNSYAIFCDYQTNQVPTRLHEMRNVLRNTNPLSQIGEVQWVRSPESVLPSKTSSASGKALAGGVGIGMREIIIGVNEIRDQPLLFHNAEGRTDSNCAVRKALQH